MNEEALGIIERVGLDFHSGCALVAILDGDFDRAEFHLARRRGAALPAPSLPDLRRTSPPDVMRDEKRRTDSAIFLGVDPAAGRDRSESIPVLRVGPGVPKLKRGESRKCRLCFKTLGCTAFARGDDVCRGCRRTEKNGTGNGTATAAVTVPRTVPKRRGRPPGVVNAKKNTPAVRPALVRTKVCVSCKSVKGYRAFDKGAVVCRDCVVARIEDSRGGTRPPAADAVRAVGRSGSVVSDKNYGLKSVASMTTNPKQAPGTLSENGVYVLTGDEYNNFKNNSTAGLYARLKGLIGKTALERVSLQTVTGFRVEVVTREEIEEGG